MLVDTSVWVDHLRRRNRALASRLEEGVVWIHPFVIGELACGSLSRQAEVLALLRALPQVEVAEHDDVLAFVEANSLMGSGIGWIDVHLLASARLTGVGLWTLDRRLASVGRRLGLAADA